MRVSSPLESETQNTPKQLGADFVAGHRSPEPGNELMDQLRAASDYFASLEK